MLKHIVRHARNTAVNAFPFCLQFVMERSVSGNKEFNVINQPAVKMVEDYASGSSPALVYKLEIQRLASNYAYIVVLPVLTSLLMLATLWMPPHSPCRFGLCKCWCLCESYYHIIWLDESYEQSEKMLRHCSWVVVRSL